MFYVSIKNKRIYIANGKNNIMPDSYVVIATNSGKVADRLLRTLLQDRSYCV